MTPLRKIVVGLAFIAVMIKCASSVQQIMAEKESVEKHNALVEETSNCLEGEDWKCAERNLKILLAESPDDRNLQLHLTGVIFEQERYEDCIAYIGSLGYENADLQFLREKSASLIHEMETLQLERSVHFRLEFEGHPARSDVMEALSVLEVAYDSLCHLFDFRPENKMKVVLFQTADYKGMGQRPDWVGAVFDGKLRIPVNVMQYREIYRPMLFHELTHGFIRAMTRSKIPTWLNEGIAQVIDASKGDMERPAGNPPTIETLTAPFLKEQQRAGALKLYWYSQKMVEAMLRHNASFPHFKDFIQSLGKMNTETALQKYYGISTQQLLNEVR